MPDYYEKALDDIDKIMKQSDEHLTFADGLRLKDLMCHFYIVCSACPLHEHDGKFKSCQDFIEAYPEEAERILLDWKKKYRNGKTTE